MNWRATWYPLAEVPSLRPLEGQRGSGEVAGEPGIAYFPAGRYPACSRHGAMNCVKVARGDEGSFWRCLAEGCNVGCEWNRP